jgi:hypothetical protein
MRSTTTLALRLSALVAAAGLLLTGCGNKTPDALVRREVAPPTTSDVAKPCTREAPEATAPAAPAPAGLAATYDQPTNTITLTGGQNVTLGALSNKLANKSLITQTGPGEWLLNATIQINQGASLKLASPDVRWLKL